MGGKTNSSTPTTETVNDVTNNLGPDSTAVVKPLNNMNTSIYNLTNNENSNMLITGSKNSGNTSVYGVTNNGSMQIGGSLPKPTTTTKVNVEQSIYNNETVVPRTNTSVVNS